LGEEVEVEALVIQYLNRLSDYLFVLSRFLTKILDAKEIPWMPEN
jgi:cob(I)alamin adenosyltransferase